MKFGALAKLTPSSYNYRNMVEPYMNYSTLHISALDCTLCAAPFLPTKFSGVEDGGIWVFRARITQAPRLEGLCIALPGLRLVEKKT